MSRVALVVTLLFAVPIVIAFIIACLVLEKAPIVIETEVPTVESSQRAKLLAKQILHTLDIRQDAATLKIAEDDLNALMTLVARGESRFAGRAYLNPGIMFVYVSVRLPSNPIGRYLNLKGELLADERGLNINQFRFGKIRCPRPLAGALLEGILNLALGNGEGSELLTSVKSVELGRKNVTVQLRSVPQLKARLKRLQASLARLRDFAPGEGAAWDSSSVTTYYLRLLEVDKNLRPASYHELTDYLLPIFALARERSVSGDPVRENSSALLAISIFLGHPLFDKLAGLEMKSQLLGSSIHGRTVLLGGRNDLRKHFVISAGLKLVSDQGISSAVGEFKELLDAGNGGSGFSFVDLAADRAGVRFAQVATDPNGGAKLLQKLLSVNAHEQLFFPAVADLPENMSEADFTARYGGINDPRYKSMENEIERRIDMCQVNGGKLRH